MKLRASDKPKTRKCLKCREDFTSEWSGNRSCAKCLKIVPNNPIHGKFIDSDYCETGTQVRSN